MGCRRSVLEKYWTNPQYLVRLNFIDDGDDENLCTMIIALMQKETRQRRLRGLEGEDYIQFRVYKVSEDHSDKTILYHYFQISSKKRYIF